MLLMLSMAYSCWGQAPNEPQGPQADLTRVSIENLMDVEVTSVSKKEQKLSQVAAAIFVITQDAGRSGKIPVIESSQNI